MTGSIVEAIQEPFQAVNRIRITVEDAPGPPELVCNAFFSGSAPRLRGIRLPGITLIHQRPCRALPIQRTAWRSTNGPVPTCPA
jgi:hypothetical protein